MDVLEINASTKKQRRQLETRLRTSVALFGNMKYVLLDEADYITSMGQGHYVV